MTYNKFDFEGESFGHPRAEVNGYAFLIPALLPEGLRLREGEVLCDLNGRVLGWRFSGESWKQWIDSEAVNSVTIRLESGHWKGKLLALWRKQDATWGYMISSENVIEFEASFGSLKKAIDYAEWRGFNFEKYKVPVEGTKEKNDDNQTT